MPIKADTPGMSASPAHAPHLTRGYAIAVAAAVVLSTTAIFIRHLTVAYAIPVLVLAFWRDAFVVLTLVPVLAAFRPSLLQVARGKLAYLALYGLVLAVFNALWTLSVAKNGAAVATVLVYSSAAFATLLAGGLLPGAASRPADLLWLGRAWSGWALVVALAAGPTVIGFGLYNAALANLPASVANLIVTLEPACTAGIAWLVLGERLTAAQLQGGLMIVAGVVLLRLSEGRAAARERPEGTVAVVEP